MSTENIARLKIKRLHDRVASIRDSDTSPFPGIEDALDELSSKINKLSDQLEKSIRLKDVDIIKSTARNINIKALFFLPIIGMILRSTNVRNAFEFLWPLQDISRKILGDQATLILSSEWDYIPFAYPQSLDDLPLFTFIGLPASESSNLLIIPLAGHELGHSIWRSNSLDGLLYNVISDKVQEYYTKNSSSFKKDVPDYDPHDIIKKIVFTECQDESQKLAIKYCEEIFCDLVGLALFGESYLWAFHYILSPDLGSSRNINYPLHAARAHALALCANEKLHLSIDKDFSANFTQKEKSYKSKGLFIIKAADSVLSDLTTLLWNEVEAIINKSGVVWPSDLISLKVANSFEAGLPSSDAGCIGDVINAGWKFFNKLDDQKMSYTKINERIELMNEMGLKSIEALEFKQRINSA